VLTEDSFTVFVDWCHVSYLFFSVQWFSTVYRVVHLSREMTFI